MQIGKRGGTLKGKKTKNSSSTSSLSSTSSSSGPSPTSHRSLSSIFNSKPGQASVPIIDPFAFFPPRAGLSSHTATNPMFEERMDRTTTAQPSDDDKFPLMI